MSIPEGSAPQDQLWRSLAERNDPESLRELVAREFPTPPEYAFDETTRRQFFRVMGASIALAGVQGCGTQQPEEPIVPYVQQPEQIVPGKPLYYATAMEHDQASLGLLAESHMARPTKIEGNPLHPAVPEIMRAANGRFSDRERIRYGATNAFAQASVLSLYDPDRSKVVKYLGQIHRWEGFIAAVRARLDALRPSEGAGLCLLTEAILSPTLLGQIDALADLFPKMMHFQWEPLARDNELLGNRLAFGQDLQSLYRFEEADVVISLDADFLANGTSSLEDVHAFASKRQVAGSSQEDMNRLYVVESAYTLTGASADHRLAVPPRDVGAVARQLAAELGLELGEAKMPASEPLTAWARAVADDLRRVRDSGGASLVLVGRWQPPAVHALAHWINSTLGNIGRSVVHVPPPGRPSVRLEDLQTLTRAMQAGEVDTLLILGGNPVFTAPGDLEFAAALPQIPFSAHLGLYEDETSAACHWHVPQTHFLEGWSDTQAADGTVSVVQPVISPLYSGRSTHEILSVLLGDPDARPFDLLQRHWRSVWEQQGNQQEFGAWWKQVLHDGVIESTAQEPVQVDVRSELAVEIQDAARDTDSASSGELLDAVFRPDPSVWDGRYANNAWLQELPRPFTKITWDNAALVSPDTARERQLRTGDVIELATGERSVRIPVWVLPGQVDGVIELHVGYGRTRVGSVGRGVGTNVYPLRSTDAMWFAPVSLQKTGATHSFATTQHHHLMEGRHLVRHGSIEEYREHPEHPPFVHPPHAHAPDPETTLYPVPDYYDGYKWGMSIDLTKCIGCNGCVVACQAENNIPVVGKEQVAVGREMHWLRIDHYYEGDMRDPESYHQPMLCQHCEYAPCEVVCPVFATTHSSEGLNEMTYNRCVGTRYCSNNCPYKVRRFNYFDYNAELRELPILQLLPNPDVTVRSRGVMEKCTFCVQRINSARIHAEKNDREIHDGEVVTACQAACPSEAIVFGDLNDETSRVRELAQSSLGYGVLEELNTRPRITYLAALKNRNPALAEGIPGDAHE